MTAVAEGPRMSTVEELVSRAAIAELQARRVRALDTKDWELYRACHTPDFVSHTVNASGLDQVVDALTERLVGVTSIHHVHSPEITLLSPTEAEAVWVLEDRLWWDEDGVEQWLRGYGLQSPTKTTPDR